MKRIFNPLLKYGLDCICENETGSDLVAIDIYITDKNKGDYLTEINKDVYILKLPSDTYTVIFDETMTPIVGAIYSIELQGVKNNQKLRILGNGKIKLAESNFGNIDYYWYSYPAGNAPLTGFVAFMYHSGIWLTSFFLIDPIKKFNCEKKENTEDENIPDKIRKIKKDYKLIGGNYIIDSSGKLQTWGYGRVSDKLNIADFENILCENLSAVAAATTVLAFYKSDDTFISEGSITVSSNTVVASTGTVAVPQEAVYFRIGYDSSKTTGILYDVVSNETIIENINFVSEKVENDLADISLLSLSPKLVGGDYRIDKTGILTAWGGAKSSDKILINNFTKIVCKNLSAVASTTTVLAFYKSDDTFISEGSIAVSSNTVVASTGIVTVPQEAAYFRICYDTAKTTGAVYILSNQYLYDTLYKSFKPYQGKNVLSCGDSFTLLNYYGAKLEATAGCRQTVNGVNGQTLKGVITGVTDEMILAADIITIMGGTNDYGHGSATAGTIYDNKDANTICGAVKYIVERILSVKPDVKLIFCTQPQRGKFGSEPDGVEPNHYGLTMYDMTRAIIATCTYMGVPCYDFWSNSGITQANLDSWLYDKLHPNKVCGDMLGYQLGEFINRL